MSKSNDLFNSLIYWILHFLSMATFLQALDTFTSRLGLCGYAQSTWFIFLVIFDGTE